MCHPVRTWRNDRFTNSDFCHTSGVDQDLLARFQAGDHSAVGDLYARYGGAVFTVAMSILRNRESAADATQQTFVKAWRNAGKFDTDREFAPWVYAIARRTAIDVLRSEKRRETVTISGEIEVIELPAGIEGAWEAFEVRQAVDQLPAEERIVIRLTHLEGFTQSQAAEELGVAVGTIKSRSHRAHRRLASLLKHLIEE